MISSSLLGGHQIREHGTQGLAAMADGKLFTGAGLAKRAAQLRTEEERVVSEAAVAAGFVQDGAFHGAAPYAAQFAAMGEALTLATRCGLNPEVVVNAVKAGLAGSAVLNAKGPMLIARNFKPGFRISLHQKDLRNALQTAEANHVFVETASHVEVKVPSA